MTGSAAPLTWVSLRAWMGSAQEEEGEKLVLYTVGGQEITMQRNGAMFIAVEGRAFTQYTLKPLRYRTVKKEIFPEIEGEVFCDGKSLSGARQTNKASPSCFTTEKGRRRADASPTTSPPLLLCLFPCLPPSSDPHHPALSAISFSGQSRDAPRAAPQSSTWHTTTPAQGPANPASR